VSDTRSRRKADRPAEVLEAALAQFAARGFAATRMEDIAARAGVSKGTIYLYYPSKEAVFEALVRANLLPVLERAEALLAEPGASPTEQLQRILGLIGQVIGNPRLVAIPRLVLAEAGNFPDLARFYRREVVGRGLGVIEALLRRGIEAGEFRPLDPVPTARLFMAPVILSALWQTTFAPIEEAPLPADAVLRQHAELFFRAIAAAPPREGQP
jgi:AcrR family transcriptional regulator